MIHNISPVNLKRPELDGDKCIGIKPYLYAGFAIRCALIFYGDYHDRSSDVKFTGLKIAMDQDFFKTVFLNEKDDF